MIDGVEDLLEGHFAAAHGAQVVAVMAGLFVEGIEFDDDCLVRVLFDYDGMESLILNLHKDGHRSLAFG